MSKMGIGQADYTAMNSIDQTTETATTFRRAVSTAEQDSPGTSYCPDWSKWFGYYKVIPELQAVINKKAIWTLGKGYEADEKTKKLLDRIRGCGKDTINDIFYNCVLQYTIAGDSFCEIVKNKRGELRNLKPINPGSITIKSNEKGIIEGYEQTILPATRGQASKVISFSPDEIFHLPWNRLGDECHGRSTIEKLVDVIESTNEAMKDLRIVFHRYVKPLIVSSVDTDDATEIANFKAKLDKAVENMENLVIPKDAVEMERVSIPQYSTLDPLPWIQLLQHYFIIAEGVPEVILGYGRDTTEASSKILYLAFQQNIEHNQRFIEQQIKAQLGLEIELNFPADISPELQGDIKKERNANNLKGGNQL